MSESQRTKAILSANIRPSEEISARLTGRRPRRLRRRNLIIMMSVTGLARDVSLLLIPGDDTHREKMKSKMKKVLFITSTDCISYSYKGYSSDRYI